MTSLNDQDDDRTIVVGRTIVAGLAALQESGFGPSEAAEWLIVAVAEGHLALDQDRRFRLP